MALRKFRSIEEKPGVAALPALREENLRIACELSELAYGLHAWRFPPGVRKYRSIEEASRARRAWENQQVRRPD